MVEEKTNLIFNKNNVLKFPKYFFHPSVIKKLLHHSFLTKILKFLSTVFAGTVKEL